jgi:hypothetical protein
VQSPPIIACCAAQACKARVWPKPETLPKVSVIIIFYNEPLSTLLRNVIGVLNRSPPALLGEIILVDDHSQMDEHAALHEHLARLAAVLPPNKVRLVRRSVHDGIVGARLRGAIEAIYPIILFLDSHAEVCDGWLEPLAARIAEDRTRVIIPNIRGVNIDTLGDLITLPQPPHPHSTTTTTRACTHSNAHAHTHTHTHMHTHSHTHTHTHTHTHPHTHTHTHTLTSRTPHVLVYKQIGTTTTNA